MKRIIQWLPFIIIMGCSTGNTGSEGSDTELSGWTKIKNEACVEVVLTSDYQSASPLNIATSGWEDGLNVSRNGLYLYATYPWYQSDIIISSRLFASDTFGAWTTSSMKRQSYSEGAVSTVFSSDHAIETVAFTSNEDYTNLNNIRIITNTTADPSGTGTDITAVSDNAINTSHTEDNPHLEKLNGNNWVLFFDSEDRPGGKGSHDIWYSTSSDSGVTWSVPANVSTVNTAVQNHQPHLYSDGTDWWLYFSQPHGDGKLAIFRSLDGCS